MSRRASVELALLLLVATAALAIRTWCIAIYAIPSGSMMPGLLAGDYLLVAKWPFAVRHEMPRRGDILVFTAPASDGRAYVKRVIGLPGDTVALRRGVVILNGRAVPRWRVADLIVPIAPATPCQPRPGSWIRREREDERATCRYARIREMPPGGRAYDILDIADTAGDDRAAMTVPSGRLFLLGDDRDRSADSRFPAGRNGGIGMVPMASLIGRAGLILFSVDGSATLPDPHNWAGAVRWRRIGTHF